MSKKDSGLNDALSFIMGKGPEAAPQGSGTQHGHSMDIIQPQSSHEVAIKEPRKALRRPGKEKLVNHHIGLYPSDWKALERMAEAEGTTVSALVRRAVRGMLK